MKLWPFLLVVIILSGCCRNGRNPWDGEIKREKTYVTKAELYLAPDFYPYEHNKNRLSLEPDNQNFQRYLSRNENPTIEVVPVGSSIIFTDYICRDRITHSYNHYFGDVYFVNSDKVFSNVVLTGVISLSRTSVALKGHERTFKKGILLNAGNTANEASTLPQEEP